MTNEERISELKKRRTDLQNSFSSNNSIDVESVDEQGNKILKSISPDSKDYVSSYLSESNRIDKQIKILELEYDYNNKKSLTYYTIEGEAKKVSFDDVNYDQAYRQQLDFIKSGTYSHGNIIDDIHKETENAAVADKIVDEIHSKFNNNEDSNDDDNSLGNEMTSSTIDTVSKDDDTASKNDSSVNKDDLDKAVDNLKYTIFKVGNVIQIIGNINSKDYLKHICSESDIIKNKNKDDIVQISTDLTPKKHWYPHINIEENDLGYDKVNVEIGMNDSITVSGADAVEYHGYVPKSTIQNHVTNEPEKKEAKVQDEEIGKLSSNPMLPPFVKKVKRHVPKKSLLTKFKELKTWKKVAIVAGFMAVVGVGGYLLTPVVSSAIHNLISSGNSEISVSTQQSTVSFGKAIQDALSKATSQAVEAGSGIIDSVNNSAVSATGSSVDLDTIVQGHSGFKNAVDAINNVNGVQLSKNFGLGQTTGITDVYNVSTGWMHLTQEQLKNPEFLKQLSQDPNNAIHITDAWFNLSDLVSGMGGKVL